MKYRIDENNFIIEKLSEGSDTGVNIELDLKDLILNSNFNNYSCLRYKYTGSLVAVDENEIYQVAAVKKSGKFSIDKDGDVVDVITIDKLSIINPDKVAIIPNEIVNNLFDESHIPLYKKVKDTVVLKENPYDTQEKVIRKDRKRNKKIIGKLRKKYSIEEELRILKDYINWHIDGEPTGDARKQTYESMNKQMDDLKKSFEE